MELLANTSFIPASNSILKIFHYLNLFFLSKKSIPCYFLVIVPWKQTIGIIFQQKNNHETWLSNITNLFPDALSEKSTWHVLRSFPVFHPLFFVKKINSMLFFGHSAMEGTHWDHVPTKKQLWNRIV